MSFAKCRKCVMGRFRGISLHIVKDVDTSAAEFIERAYPVINKEVAYVDFYVTTINTTSPCGKKNGSF